MLTRKSGLLVCFLLALSIGQTGNLESDDQSSSSADVVTVDSCAVKFVNISTYATERPGIIAELPFEEGDIVQAGDLVVQLRDEVAQANLRLRVAQAAMTKPIAIAIKERDAAEIALTSAQNANKVAANAFPATEIERLQLIYDARILQVQQAEEEVSLSEIAKEQADAELLSYSVHAKFSGLVTKVHKHVGEAVNLDDDIITIVDTNRVRVSGWIRYEDARKIQVGDGVRIQLDFSQLKSGLNEDIFSSDVLNIDDDLGGAAETPQRTPLPEEEKVFAGRVGFIGVDTRDDSGYSDELRVWAEVENRDNILLEGLPAKMTIQVRPRVTTR
ncbi:MAG: HlyD family efflux transporter periplasmic adaptor subunit [Planctomycetaceae bacterium]|nr:HlyD family efflux transporter periplasmic adaptor subunit [Planctomycetaceae bacterium]